MPNYRRDHATAAAWAREMWGPDGVAVRATDGRYLIGRIESSGWLGTGVRYYGSSDAGWAEALADAQSRPLEPPGRGWTNAVKGLSR